MVNFNGKYVLEKKENFAEFLKAIGAPEESIKKVDLNKPELEITGDGTEFTITNKSIRETTLKFTLNKEFEESFTEGEKFKSTATLAGNKLTITSDSVLATRTYEFSDEGVLVSLTNPKTDVIAKLFHKRV